MFTKFNVCIIRDKWITTTAYRQMCIHVQVQVHSNVQCFKILELSIKLHLTAPLVPVTLGGIRKKEQL